VPQKSKEERAETPVRYLRDVDPSLLKGARGGVVGAEVPVLAPVAAESAVHTRQAPGGREDELRRRSSPWEVSVGTDRPSQKSRRRVLHGQIISLEGRFDTTKVTDRLGKHTFKRQSLSNLTTNSLTKYKLGFTAHRCIGVK